MSYDYRRNQARVANVKQVGKHTFETQEDLLNDLKEQIEQKKKEKAMQQAQEKQEILDHYKNYNIGNGDSSMY